MSVAGDHEIIRGPLRSEQSMVKRCEERSMWIEVSREYYQRTCER